jgi:hypothetical protein
MGGPSFGVLVEELAFSVGGDQPTNASQRGFVGANPVVSTRPRNGSCHGVPLVVRGNASGGGLSFDGEQEVHAVNFFPIA